ncbi:parallel beta-helix domain-containing protein [uncultured Parasphingopyxis sp.]|uniref:parallel beta-helix domain-containing protein n=1 Tax=uncultured Parasphingopyxis sp. TaxID=1547918 RepID=UPI00262FAF74|nr:parallel beta-helix domain-containing protein [uncultured Parasphingopyxis sp.]
MKLLAAATLSLLVTTSAFAAIHNVEAGPDAQERLQTALIEAEPGDTVQIGEGRFELTDGLSLDVDRVTVAGAGADATILDFTNQQGAGEGLYVTSDDVVLRDFAIENTTGDGIKSKDADRITYTGLRVEWTGGPSPDNGAYGIYPVESTHVLVQNSIVRGASDAGIYVGQSDQIVVRHNVVEQNVAGIEIENSYNADVYENAVSQNTGGILVFDLPNLPQMGGHSVRVFRNAIADNNTDNFAPEGNIVAGVPAGTGIMVMANRNVHIFENALTDNGSASVMIVAYRQPFEDENYNPLPRDVVVRDNVQNNAGYAPDFAGGAELAAAMGGRIPPIFWDGNGSGIVVNENTPVLSLGLTRPGQPVTEARPAPADLRSDSVPTEPEAVVLPDSMAFANE